MIEPVMTANLRGALDFALLHLGGSTKTEHDIAEARDELMGMVGEFRADGIADDCIADELTAYTRKKIEERANG